jgi:hypothetical protein
LDIFYRQQISHIQFCEESDKERERERERERRREREGGKERETYSELMGNLIMLIIWSGFNNVNITTTVTKTSRQLNSNQIYPVN